MRITAAVALSTSLALASGASAAEPELPFGTSVTLLGVFEPGNLSGVCAMGDFLVVGTDEGELADGVDTRKVQVLRREGTGWTLAHDVGLPAKGTTEIDVEGIACDGTAVHVVGSHSSARRKVDDDRRSKPYEENRKRLLEVKREDSRDALYRFTIGDDGAVDPTQIVRTSLRSALEEEESLALALQAPSKENGVDIEGIAVKSGEFYVAFRGPVLREGWVPIMRVAATDVGNSSAPPKPQMSYVNLGGLGIRDLASVKDGFVLIAGPVGDGPPEFRLYFWDGADMIPGKGSPNGRVRLLGRFPDSAGKPEGLAVLDENDAGYQLLIVYDDSSLADGAKIATATLLEVAR